MATRYERYNEITFDAYCKAAVDKAILKERLRKGGKGQREQPLSSLLEKDIPSVSMDELEQERSESAGLTFQICGELISVKDLKLGQALFCLLPRERAIILLRYFRDMKDVQIAQCLGMTRATVQRKRKRAEVKLRVLLEAGP